MKSDSDHDWLRTGLVKMTTMRADDSERWEPKRLVKLAKSFSLDALGFSVGGVTAFYPTGIEGHAVSPSLGGRDLAAETIAALHRAGLRTIYTKRIALNIPPDCRVVIAEVVVVSLAHSEINSLRTSPSTK